MKKILLTAAAVAAVILGTIYFAGADHAVNCGVTPYCRGDIEVKAPKGMTKAEVIIDVDEPLPTSITMPKSGGTITFVRKTKPSTADVAVEVQGTDGDMQPLMVSATTLPTAPTDYEVVGQYTAGRPGHGELIVEHTVREPGATPYQERVGIILQ